MIKHAATALTGRPGGLTLPALSTLEGPISGIADVIGDEKRTNGGGMNTSGESIRGGAFRDRSSSIRSGFNRGSSARSRSIRGGFRGGIARGAAIRGGFRRGGIGRGGWGGGDGDDSHTVEENLATDLEYATMLQEKKNAHNV
ncbi:hypothetical protein DL93DRAFT_2081258 [Clavulina sp. PMI_390]|nr:hypothetical protein DL93DRAFT_2081258 [Clavulina sp. PMI_390]